MNTLIQNVCTDFLECPTGMHEGGVTDSGYRLRNYSLFFVHPVADLKIRRN